MASTTGTTIGIRMPNVPQAVPVEKDRKAAITKITAGRKIDHSAPPEVTMDCTKSGVWRRSRQTPESVQASTRMMLAGSMSFMPSTRPLMKSVNGTRPRGTYIRKAMPTAPKEAQTRDGAAEELPSAEAKVWYFGSAPQ